MSLPKQVLDIVGDARKGSSLGRIMTFGGAVALLLPLLVGHYSDRFKGFPRMIQKFLPSGRRRPFHFSRHSSVLYQHIGAISMRHDAGPHVCLDAGAVYIKYCIRVVSSGLLPDAVDKTQLGLLAELGGLTAFGQLIGSSVGLFVDSWGIKGCHIFL